MISASAEMWNSTGLTDRPKASIVAIVSDLSLSSDHLGPHQSLWVDRAHVDRIRLT